jgi:hypothetical protein
MKPSQFSDELHEQKPATIFINSHIFYLSLHIPNTREIFRLTFPFNVDSVLHTFHLPLGWRDWGNPRTAKIITDDNLAKILIRQFTKRLLLNCLDTTYRHSTVGNTDSTSAHTYTVIPRYTSLIRSRSLDLPNRTYTKRIVPIRNKGKMINPFSWKKKPIFISILYCTLMGLYKIIETLLNTEVFNKKAIWWNEWNFNLTLRCWEESSAY